jgi:hypothetical protein
MGRSEIMKVTETKKGLLLEAEEGEDFGLEPEDGRGCMTLEEMEARGAAEELFHAFLEEEAGYYRVRPVDLGALTSCPFIYSDLPPPDEHDPVDEEGRRVWWYPDYAVRDPRDELRRSGRVVLVEAVAE